MGEAGGSPGLAFSGLWDLGGLGRPCHLVYKYSSCCKDPGEEAWGHTWCMTGSFPFFHHPSFPSGS